MWVVGFAGEVGSLIVEFRSLFDCCIFFERTVGKRLSFHIRMLV
jgi:hypothetical protein